VLASIARMERSEIRGGIDYAPLHPGRVRFTLFWGGSTAAGGRGGVLGTAASTNFRQRCHPTRRASRVDLPLQGRWGDFVSAVVRQQRLLYLWAWQPPRQARPRMTALCLRSQRRDEKCKSY